MKYSIKYLPKKRQEELNTLVELITKHVKKCEMIILYGSYARNDYVFYDQRIEYGRRTTFQSDYDLMVVVSGVDPFVVSRAIDRYVIEDYQKRHHDFPDPPFPSIIIEDIERLNKQIKRRKYFYLDVLKEGRKIYDTGNFKLAKPQVLTPVEIKEEALDYFEDNFPFADGFLDIASYAIERPVINLTAFQLHQACENFYKTLSLVHVLDARKEHDLVKLESKNKQFSREIVAAFPKETEFEQRCYKLLLDGYIRARYDRNYKVTKGELRYMMSRIDILKEIVKKACEERLAYYDKLIEEESNNS